MIKISIEKDQLNLEIINKKILINIEMKRKENYYQQDFKIQIIFYKVIIGEKII